VTMQRLLGAEGLPESQVWIEDNLPHAESGGMYSQAGAERGAGAVRFYLSVSALGRAFTPVVGD